MPDDDTLAGSPTTLAPGRFIVGTPDDCLEQLLAWRRVGIDHFLFRCHWSGMPIDTAQRTLRLLSDHVLPILRQPETRQPQASRKPKEHTDG